MCRSCCAAALEPCWQMLVVLKTQAPTGSHAGHSARLGVAGLGDRYSKLFQLLTLVRKAGVSPGSKLEELFWGLLPFQHFWDTCFLCGKHLVGWAGWWEQKSQHDLCELSRGRDVAENLLYFMASFYSAKTVGASCFLKYHGLSPKHYKDVFCPVQSLLCICLQLYLGLIFFCKESSWEYDIVLHPLP